MGKVCYSLTEYADEYAAYLKLSNAGSDFVPPVLAGRHERRTVRQARKGAEEILPSAGELCRDLRSYSLKALGMIILAYALVRQQDFGEADAEKTTLASDENRELTSEVSEKKSLKAVDDVMPWYRKLMLEPLTKQELAYLDMVEKYPRLFAEVDRKAKEHGIDRAIARALVIQESGLATLYTKRIYEDGRELKVKSYAGAKGPAAVMRRTCRDFGKRFGSGDCEWGQMFNYRENLEVGFSYLNHLTERFGGDISLALLAYNWGPGHVDGKLGHYGNFRQIQAFLMGRVENGCWNFKEPLEYVPKVLGKARIMRNALIKSADWDYIGSYEDSMQAMRRVLEDEKGIPSFAASHPRLNPYLTSPNEEVKEEITLEEIQENGEKWLKSRRAMKRIKENVPSIYADGPIVIHTTADAARSEN